MEQEHIIDIPEKKIFKIIMLHQSNQTFFYKEHSTIIQFTQNSKKIQANLQK